MSVFITFFGTATMLIEIGHFRILTDPVFAKKGHADSVLGLAKYQKTYDPIVSDVSLEPLDVSLITHHHHADNFDNEGFAAAKKAKLILSTTKAASKFPDHIQGIVPWQSVEIQNSYGEKLKITATPAQHGPWILNWLTGPVIGFILEWEGQKNGTLYISGDTVLFSGIQEVAKRFKIHTSILHIGRAHFSITPFFDYTFSAEGAAQAVSILNSQQVIPIHYEGWSHFKGGKEKIKKVFDQSQISNKSLWLDLGKRTEINI